MKLYEIIRSVTWTRLKKKIHKLFPESEAHLPEYRTAFETLRKTAPAETDLILYVWKEVLDDGPYALVACYDPESHKGLDELRWAVVLGMEVRMRGRYVPKVETVARVLERMTFWGFSEEQAAARRERIHGI